MDNKSRELLRSLGFNKQIDRVEHGLCPFCNKKIDPSEFRDKRSRDEYQISGLCQSCQDLMFGSPRVKRERRVYR